MFSLTFIQEPLTRNPENYEKLIPEIKFGKTWVGFYFVKYQLLLFEKTS